MAHSAGRPRPTNQFWIGINLVRTGGPGRVVETSGTHGCRWAFAIHDESPDWGLLSLTAPTTWSEAGRDMETRILPALKEHTPDEGLIACWMRYPDPFLPPVERLAYLALLAQELGPASTYEFATAELAAVLAGGGPELPGLKQVAPIIRQLGMLVPS